MIGFHQILLFSLTRRPHKHYFYWQAKCWTCWKFVQKLKGLTNQLYYTFVFNRAHQRRTGGGNTHRMTDLRDDDDDMSTYNGNSTQQMWFNNFVIKVKPHSWSVLCDIMSSSGEVASYLQRNISTGKPRKSVRWTVCCLMTELMLKRC